MVIKEPTSRVAILRSHVLNVILRRRKKDPPTNGTEQLVSPPSAVLTQTQHRVPQNDVAVAERGENTFRLVSQSRPQPGRNPHITQDLTQQQNASDYYNKQVGMYKHRHKNTLHPKNCNLYQAALQRCMTNTTSQSTAGQQKRKQLFLDPENDSAADEHRTRTGYIQLASPPSQRHYYQQT